MTLEDGVYGRPEYASGGSITVGGQTITYKITPSGTEVSVSPAGNSESGSTSYFGGNTSSDPLRTYIGADQMCTPSDTLRTYIEGPVSRGSGTSGGGTSGGGRTYSPPSSSIEQIKSEPSQQINPQQINQQEQIQKFKEPLQSGFFTAIGLKIGETIGSYAERGIGWASDVIQNIIRQESQKSYEPSATQIQLTQENPLHNVGYFFFGKAYERMLGIETVEPLRSIETEKSEQPLIEKLATSGGVAGGLWGSVYGAYKLVETGATKGVIEAGKELVHGTTHFLVSAPFRIASGNPAEIGGVVGEFIGGALVAKGVGKAVSGAKWVAERPLHVPAEKVSSVPDFYQKPSTERVPLGTPPEVIKERLLDPTYKIGQDPTKVWHATPVMWSPEGLKGKIMREYVVQQGKSPTGGLYTSHALYFTFALPRSIYKSKSLIEMESKPAGIHIKTKGIELPKKADVTPEELKIAQELIGGRAKTAEQIREFAQYKKWLEQYGDPSKAYISPEVMANIGWKGALEVEAIIRAGSVLRESLRSSIFHRFTEVKVPVKKFTKEAEKEFVEFQKPWKEKLAKATKEERRSILEEYLKAEKEFLTKLEQSGKIYETGFEKLRLQIREMKTTGKVAKVDEVKFEFDPVEAMRRGAREYVFAVERGTRRIRTAEEATFAPRVVRNEVPRQETGRTERYNPFDYADRYIRSMNVLYGERIRWGTTDTRQTTRTERIDRSKQERPQPQRLERSIRSERPNRSERPQRPIRPERLEYPPQNIQSITTSKEKIKEPKEGDEEQPVKYMKMKSKIKKGLLTNPIKSLKEGAEYVEEIVGLKKR